ncbi:MAG: tetratricopeptide repeat protein [Actinobacteria bacterium]|nr:tetratricopeptide repeat protein [Actinomycetota bacterium]
MPFFMDKKNASLWVKIFAAILAFSFILGMVVFTVDAFIMQGSMPNQNTNKSKLSQEEVQFDTNVRMYKSMTEMNTTDTTAWVGLGNSYYDWGIYLIRTKKNSMEALKKFAEAEKAYEKALELNPDNVNVMVDLAAIYFYQAKLQEARSLLDKALEKDPNNPAALFNAGLVARDQGDTKAAIAYFEKFIKENPGDRNISAAKNLLKELKGSLGNTTSTKSK